MHEEYQEDLEFRLAADGSTKIQLMSLISRDFPREGDLDFRAYLPYLHKLNKRKYCDLIFYFIRKPGCLWSLKCDSRVGCGSLPRRLAVGESLESLCVLDKTILLIILL